MPTIIDPDAIRKAQLQAAVSLATSNPDLTLQALHDGIAPLLDPQELKIGHLLGTIELEPKKSRYSSAPTRWDTASEEGREVLDTAVLHKLIDLDEWTSAEALKADLEATPHQLRGSFARLLEGKFIRRKGRLRATRYKAAP